MDIKPYNRANNNSTNAIALSINRIIPFVLRRANVTKSEATAIKPMAIKDTHILSNDDNSISILSSAFDNLKITVAIIT
jgi:hypothetical protein